METGRGIDILNRDTAEDLMWAVRVAVRNDFSHLENNTRNLLSALMGLERDSYREGRLEATADGIALGTMVLLMGRSNFNYHIEQMRGNSLDYDPPSSGQLRRIRDVFVRR